MGTATIAPTANKYYTLVVVSGTSVKGYVDGQLVASVTDAHNSTSTKHGMVAFGNTGQMVGFKASQ